MKVLSFLVALIASSVANAAVFNLACPTGYVQCPAGTTSLTLSDTVQTISNCRYDSCPQLLITNSNVTFSNVTFSNSVNSNSVVKGGAVYITITADNTLVSLTDVRFEGNALGSSSFGGALCIEGSAVNTSPINITNLVLVGNTADRGGAVYIVNKRVNFNNIYATGNLGNVRGGAIYLNVATFTSTNGTFINNQTPGAYGCDYYFLNSPGRVVGHYSRGGVADDGGSVLQYGGPVHFENFESSGCTMDGGSPITVYGNGVAEPGSLTNFRIFNNNGKWGGAVYIEGVTTYNLTNGRIYNNSGGSSCGGIYYGSVSNTNIKNVTFEFNTATSDGGDIIFSGATVAVIDSCTFKYPVSGDGGSIVVGGGLVTLTNGQTIGAMTTGSGGVIYLYSSASISIRNWQFLSNFAISDAAVLYAADRSNIVTLSNVTCNGNKALRNGGVIFGNGGNFTLSNVTTLKSFALNGADFYMTGVASLTINGLASSGAESINGTIYNTGNSTLNLVNGQFTNCKSNSSGAALFLNVNSKCTVNNLVLEGNRAVNGAGIYALRNTQLSISNSLSVRNSGPVNSSSSVSGSALMLVGANTSATNLLFNSNYQKDFLINGGTFTCSGCSKLLWYVNCLYSATGGANVTMRESNCGTVATSFMTSTTADSVVATSTTTNGGISSMIYGIYVKSFFTFLITFIMIYY